MREVPALVLAQVEDQVELLLLALPDEALHRRRERLAPLARAERLGVEGEDLQVAEGAVAPAHHLAQPHCQPILVVRGARGGAPASRAGRMVSVRR